ncbi:MAG: TetR/AcrR family transcriptional regulator [Firmicutes bacterium]|nr:TetR/AcrR family transcriptional regulator [Bacillota bacterium]
MSPRKGLDLPVILQTAAAIADDAGFDAVTVAAIAERLGVRPPSLYNHVSGLADLQKKLAVYGLERLLEALTDAVVGRSGDDAIRSMGGAYLGFARRHRGLYEATIRAMDMRDPAVQRSADAIVGLVARVLGFYGLHRDEAIHAVRGLRSILHGFASLERNGQFGLPLEADTSFQILLDIFLAGLNARIAREKPDRAETGVLSSQAKDGSQAEHPLTHQRDMIYHHINLF